MPPDVIVVGAGTAGCILAARLSENPDRQVCLLEAGPDYGPLVDGRWPAEILDARTTAETHRWGPAGEDARDLGGRIVGGSSAVNACVVVKGSVQDYDEWGSPWTDAELRPFLDRARRALRTARSNADDAGPFHDAFVESGATATGLPRLDDLDDPEQPVGVGVYPANVVDGVRWSAALAYLEDSRSRPNLAIEAGTLVDRVVLRKGRATGVVDASGAVREAGTVILAAGAYFSAAILLRSGVGPARELRRHRIEQAVELPVGERLLDHCGIPVVWSVAQALFDDASRRSGEGRLVGPSAVMKAASTSCPPETWDLHLLPWISHSPVQPEVVARCLVFHMKPRSHGRLGLHSPDPLDLPHVERGFLRRDEDLVPLLEGIELARGIGATPPLRDLLDGETRPGADDLETYVRDSVHSYFHPAGTCAIGEVVDTGGRVLGLEGLLVADASIMPTIPRANTNLPTAAIAERIAETLD